MPDSDDDVLDLIIRMNSLFHLHKKVEMISVITCFSCFLLGNTTTMSISEFFQKNRVGHHKPWESGKHSAKDNFPDLSKHNNVMSSHLSLAVSVIFSLI